MNIFSKDNPAGEPGESAPLNSPDGQAPDKDLRLITPRPHEVKPNLAHGAGWTSRASDPKEAA